MCVFNKLNNNNNIYFPWGTVLVLYYILQFNKLIILKKSFPEKWVHFIVLFHEMTYIILFYYKQTVNILISLINFEIRMNFEKKEKN